MRRWASALADIVGRVFDSTLIRWPGAASWVFARVPAEHAPESAGPFGRVPVTATVDGVTWSTSVWRDKREGWLLPVPAKIRRGKDDGDVVSVEVAVDESRL
jgi:hypothetical protein